MGVRIATRRLTAAISCPSHPLLLQPWVESGSFPLSRALCSSRHPAPMFPQAVACHTSEPPVGELHIHATTLPGPRWAQQLLSRGVLLNLDAAAARPQSIL